jgi:hypothetical protein
VPAAVVVGVGAVAELVPPVATVYHFKPAPVAVNATAVAFTQYDRSATVGADGIGLIVTVVVTGNDTQLPFAADAVYTYVTVAVPDVGELTVAVNSVNSVIVPRLVVNTPMPPADDGVAVIVLSTVGHTAAGDGDKVAVGIG